MSSRLGTVPSGRIVFTRSVPWHAAPSHSQRARMAGAPGVSPALNEIGKKWEAARLSPDVPHT